MTGKIEGKVQQLTRIKYSGQRKGKKSTTVMGFLTAGLCLLLDIREKVGG